jgi:protein-S-isoprenylcysteine O-methyltransferase Ste14
VYKIFSLNNIDLLFAFIFIIIYGIRLGYQAYLLQKREEASKKGKWAELLLVIVPKNILVILTIYLLATGIPRTSVFWIGWIIFLVGIIMRMIALKQLGSMYSMNVEIRDQHKLINTGIYSLVRHPLYLAYFIDTLGIILFLQKIYFPPILILTFWGLKVRLNNEEKELNNLFGNAYKEYSSKVPAINIFKNILPKNN